MYECFYFIIFEGVFAFARYCIEMRCANDLDLNKKYSIELVCPEFG